jgi:hypothetical protein
VTGNRFTYSLDVPALRGDDALQRFVLEDRVGYCEYFATAMAVMLRASGIPARVAVGFLPGAVTLAADPEAGRDLTEFTVSTEDAHAWVEVLFPGYGWVTFEPTPRSDQTQLVPTAENLAPVENLREQRAREFFIDGHRLGDLRRYEAHHSVDLWPSGSMYGTTTTFGEQKCWPTPVSELF